MGAQSVRLYYNTGFDNPIDIPDSPALLDSCFYRDISGHWNYQDFYLNEVKINCTYDIVKNAEYIKYGNAYYKITNINMINENCASLSLDLDALTSMGGPSHLNYDDGIITRAHCLDDTLFSNICEEPIGCREELKLEDLGVIGGAGSDDEYTIIVSPVALNIADPEANAQSITFYDGLGNATVDVPKCPIQSPSTEVALTLPNGTKQYDSKQLGYYMLGHSASDDVLLNKNLDYLRSLGLESAVLYCYNVPEDYIHSNITTIGPYIEHIQGNLIRGTAQGANIKNGYSNIQNNKTYYMFNSFIIRSNTSGDMKEYKASELWDSTHFNNLSAQINFNVLADPQYGGRPYCFPEYYHGEKLNNPTYQSVAGLQWYDLPIVYTRASGERFNYNNYKLNEGGIKLNAMSDPKTGISRHLRKLEQATGLGNYMDLGGLTGSMDPSKVNDYGIFSTGSAASMYGGLTKTDYKLTSAEIEYEQSRVVAPELSSTPAQGLQRFIKNDFELYRMRPSDRDISAIDKYFTMFGYAQPNIVFDKAYLSGRQNFNYIKCSGVKITRDSISDPFGLAVKAKAEEQLNNSVRIWHTLPHKITSNPITS